VQPGPFTRKEIGVDRFLDQGMTEPEAIATRVDHQQAVGHRRPQRPLQLPTIQAGHGCQ
jgi:hypothetical protein